MSESRISRGRRCIGLAVAVLLTGAAAAAGIEIDRAHVRAAFVESHAGYSADEVIVRDDLNAAFLNACARLHRRSADRLGDEKEAAFVRGCNRTLLNLRKAGGLSGEDARTTRRHVDRADAPDEDAYRHAAEIAARRVSDAHAATLDDVLCDPVLRAAFAAEGHRVAGPVPGLRDEDLRRAALTLRKSRRLRPELVVRVADWGRVIGTAPAEALASGETALPTGPGVYLFTDRSGYLYIGEAMNLASRLAQHLNESDRTALRHHLAAGDPEKSPEEGPGEGLSGVGVEWHAFDPESDARLARYRRAYESDLIASRQPRFNVRP